MSHTLRLILYVSYSMSPTLCFILYVISYSVSHTHTLCVSSLSLRLQLHFLRSVDWNLFQGVQSNSSNVSDFSVAVQTTSIYLHTERHHSQPPEVYQRSFPSVHPWQLEVFWKPFNCTGLAVLSVLKSISTFMWIFTVG